MSSTPWQRISMQNSCVQTFGNDEITVRFTSGEGKFHVKLTLELDWRNVGYNQCKTNALVCTRTIC